MYRLNVIRQVVFCHAPPERSGIILLKLKRKLQFRGHVYFQAVRPHFVLQALQWLKANITLHKDIQIDVNDIDTNLTVLHETEKTIQLQMIV